MITALIELVPKPVYALCGVFLIAVGVAQGVALLNAHKTVSGLRVELADLKRTSAEAARAQEAQFRAKEQSWQVAQQENQREVQKALDAARADADRADAASVRLRQQVATLLAAARAPKPAGPVVVSPPTEFDALGMLAVVFGEVDAAAGALARIADDSRARGLACEREYEMTR